MSWLKRLIGRRSAAQSAAVEKTPAQEDDPAYQQGQEMARIMVGAVDEFLATRFGTLKDDFLAILRKSILADIGQEDYSPILGVRSSVADLMEQADKAEVGMAGECEIAMYDYRRAFESMGLDGEVERAIKARVGDIALGIKLGAIEMATTFADAAKAADSDWRRRHPDKAAAQPLVD